MVIHILLLMTHSLKLMQVLKLMIIPACGNRLQEKTDEMKYTQAWENFQKHIITVRFFRIKKSLMIHFSFVRLAFHML